MDQKVSRLPYFLRRNPGDSLGALGGIVRGEFGKALEDRLTGNLFPFYRSKSFLAE